MMICRLAAQVFDLAWFIARHPYRPFTERGIRDGAPVL